ncbi:MAG: 30S ribosomal protein S6 [Christensenellaceae bacterium]|jgi:small subunit ribosomal protein S6|nr:30S ribosomal protein S6 [Christensenellaceae bacterium]
MTKYQLLYIIDASLEKEARQAIVDKYTELITSLGGSITKTDQWDKRTLAYPINRKTEGFYVLVLFEGPSTIPLEVNRQMRISDVILRQLITLDE